MTTKPTGIGQTLSQSLRLSSDAMHEREKAEEAERAAYRRQYWQGYVKKVKRIFGTVTPEDFEAVQLRAEDAGRSIWGQVWAESQAYLAGQTLATGEIADRQRELVAELRRMGRGKSSTFVLPNLLSPPSSLPSFVVSDTSGELYQASSGYLASRGYLIRVLNLMDPAHSETYNPLANATAPQHLAELAKTLVRSASGRSAGQVAHDPFWDQSAEKMIRLLAQCLLNQPDPSYRNLANLRHLVLGFDAHVAPQGQLGQIDRFVLNATQNDQSTFAAYRAFVQGNLKTIQSVLMTADVALDAIATPEMAALTATNTLNFGELRHRPTALYVMVNQTQMELYAFLLNLFYADLFKALLKNPTNPGRPVWLFLDEFGHLQIPGFEVFATTARKYKVSYSLFLQSLAQLEGRYGAQNARTIVEGLGTEIYLPGTSLETARNLEARLGRSDKAPLMAANDIIRMDEDQALMLYSNRLPVLLKTKRYYQRADLRRRARKSTAPLPYQATRAPVMIPF
ncbi:type IV secretory system conjugative DNA transfer family protein [Ruegeria aquimaris]|uniref:Type IV secretory system conjugative DNA transfer family protein n=1 Tax=Ruegeria aquimaris TaxID=2984333 RepID=A0ABT3ARG6_9RHOB|nr:type IV secretory system conjugative DNA transfer family protein [Ruegeria sp. XHP0148]MCV2891282.1 type IV secretory system conjugative DNA transfer family protein [Ruegeria sp. XHP0148]